MFNAGITFDRPAYLLLLALIPLIWVFTFRTLAGLGRRRRWIAIGLRSLVLTLIVFALAEVHWVRTTDRLTVIYLLDQSRSIPPEQRRAMVEFAKADVRRHRNANRQDRAGVIVFGGDAKPEIPPFDDDLAIVGTIESSIDAEHTNLADAMKMAQAMFSDDTAKRIVVISDGNENQGHALEQAESLARAGISTYVVPVRYPVRREVAVERVTIPSNVNRGQPFDIRVVLNNTADATENNAGEVRGRLRLSRRVGGQSQDLLEEEVTLEPGKTVFRFEQQIDEPDFYRYEARFVPDDANSADLVENNQASAHAHVRGQGQVLLIEEAGANNSPHEFLVQRLRAGNLEVMRMDTDALFSSLAELQAFDAVILGNVPREHFSDLQIDMLVGNTRQLGAGLIMLGGENSFGAGGWTNTELEKAMPVDFEIKNAKVQAVGALALLMHASEMPEGNYWQRIVAQESIKALGTQDYCGLIHWGAGQDEWLWGGIRRVSGNREKMLGMLQRMSPGDMPAFEPAMRMALQDFINLPAEVAVKHMIIISDGDPSPPSAGVVNALRQNGVTVTTVAIGSHGTLGSSVLQDIAAKTGGKYHVVSKASALPKIYQKEVRAIARPVIYDPGHSMQPRLRGAHPITRGLEGLPPIRGYVLTQRKQHSLAEVLAISPEPASEDTATLLAAWPYGLGKSVALTTDAGSRWAQSWVDWAGYDRLMVGMVRWALRPPGDTGNFSVVTDLVDGRVRVTVTALDEKDEFVNFLDMAGSVLRPDMQPEGVKLEQTAPGRYVGEFDASDAGSYLMLLSPGAGMAPLRVGVNVPYSAEYLDREPDEALLETLADLQPEGGAAGVVIEQPALEAGPPWDEEFPVDTFQHDLPKSVSRREAWYLLVWLAGLVFFADVFTRRVAVSFAWAPVAMRRLRDRLRGETSDDGKTELLERLRNRKSEVAGEIEQRKGTSRFEASDEQMAAAPPQPGSKTPPPPKPAAPQETPKAEDSYTSRLLKAKEQARKEQQRERRE